MRVFLAVFSLLFGLLKVLLTSSELFGEIQHARHQVKVEKSNNLLLLHPQLAAVARFSNLLYLESCLLQKSCNVDHAISELTNIQNGTILGTIEKVNTEKVLEVIRKLENQPHTFLEEFSSINEAMEAFEKLQKLSLKSEKLFPEAKVNEYITSVESLKTTVIDAIDVPAFSMLHMDLQNIASIYKNS
ncbi:unnamed protein product [Caenorhabditis sp. 36 PRJEB53466]|nr:unnamed protein product [Caenorhabditis sp. 36 PRJEB53466]